MMFFAIGLVFLGLFFAFQRVTKGTKKVNYMSTPMVNAILPLEKTYALQQEPRKKTWPFSCSQLPFLPVLCLFKGWNSSSKNQRFISTSQLRHTLVMTV